MTWWDNDRGVSLIAAVFIIVVLAFMGVMFVSLITTSSLTSVNDMQSAQALYIAEGGVEYTQYSLAQNLDWYRSASDPMPAPASTTLNLGAGSFTVVANLPATMLSKKLHSGEPNTVNVYTTDRFPATGLLQIDDDAGLGSGEFVRYTGKTATTFTVLPINRGVLFIGGTLGNTASDFPRGTRVYPVATLLTPNPLPGPGNCTPVVITLTVAVDNNKFLSAGTINVYDRNTLDSEEIAYAGSSTSGGVMTLTGVRRCLNGTSATANAGDPVTPINVNSPVASPDFEAEIVSTGTAGSAVRVVRKTVQR